MSSSSERNQSCQCQPLISNIFSPWNEECLTHPFPKHSQTPRTPISQCPKAILTAQTSTGFFLKSGSLFWKSQRFLLKKKRTVSKTTGKFTFFAARSLLLGNNQLSSWADFKLYFLKKDQLSALTHWVLQLYKIMFKEKCLCYRNDPSHLKGASPPAPSSTRKKKY